MWAQIQSDYCQYKKRKFRNSLEVQWLELHAFTAKGPGSVPGWGAKILRAERHGPKKKRRRGNLDTEGHAHR